MSELGASWTPAVLQLRVSTLETYNLTAYYSHRGIAYDFLSFSKSVARLRCVRTFNYFHHITRP